MVLDLERYFFFFKVLFLVYIERFFWSFWVFFGFTAVCFGCFLGLDLVDLVVSW